MGERLIVQRLEGEYWWGGDIEDGIRMPFGEERHTRDLIREGRSNQAVPFLVSSLGRYIWSEEPFRFEFDPDELVVECEAGSSARLGEGHGSLREAYRAASHAHFAPDGRWPDPMFFAAPQYNLWIELQYEPTQEKVLAYAEAALRNGMPPGILMIDDNWMEDYGVWTFRKDRFPDPKAMCAKLREMGFKVMLWICPFVSPDNAANFRFLERQGYLLRNATGETAVRRWWNGYSAVLDCTNEAAVRWFDGELERLMTAYGVDGFKFDAGDPQYYRADDRSAAGAHPNGHCEAWARVGLRYALNEYRACWKSAGRPLVQRLADKNHSWGADGLASLIPNGLAQGLAGYAFVCPDMIGGGQIADVENRPDRQVDQELFVRYAQCSALFPMMQFSAAPWRALDDEHLAACVAAADLHRSFGDLILALARQAAITGEPIIRHLDYVFPGEGFERLTDQFMLGDTILASPVLMKGARRRKVEFPLGKWLGDDGSVVIGPCVRDIDAPLTRLPWYRLIG
ncbi:glycoside hydrolase family 31 protein [Paenibacillus methanolicus]|uniref:Glycosyl hydrolase family 31 n=1 Tax=Paenibacillus methanolicus TaxID=582686 RepID=A0A5S5CHT7_9BACL|nr:glycoside hydrolase family 31 protein [Paenibacillus methanolicus]TYP79094.1 glycosyl hydrolase family 31 [Paenibacillus methanolicus]